ncbi:hypothetical protein WJX72_006856 [[Myrmecia] bisecta]|uniref:Uncharacterized protein n=1 Tax=[Myrmecia] bisecta TaxID=41462 RepID=A0AAW1Q0D2_9CHLO
MFTPITDKMRAKVAGAQSAASPGLAKLDRVLALVTAHEASYREQEMQLEHMTTRLVYLEDQLRVAKAFEVADHAKELAAARIAIEQLHQQVKTLHEEREMSRAQHEEAVEALRQRQARSEAQVQRLVKMAEQQKREQQAAITQLQASTSAFLTKIIDSIGTQMQTIQTNVMEAVEDKTAAQIETSQAGYFRRDDAKRLQHWMKQKVAALQEQMQEQYKQVAKHMTELDEQCQHRLARQSADHSEQMQQAQQADAELARQLQEVQESSAKLVQRALKDHARSILAKENLPPDHQRPLDAALHQQQEAAALQVQIQSLAGRLEGVAAEAEHTRRQLRSLQHIALTCSKDVATLADGVTTVLHEPTQPTAVAPDVPTRASAPFFSLAASSRPGKTLPLNPYII